MESHFIGLEVQGKHRSSSMETTTAIQIDGSSQRSAEIEDPDFVDCRGKPCDSNKSGGLKAAAFILVVQGLDVMAMTAVQNNLIRYLYKDMHFSVAESANMVTSYAGTAYLLALPGGFVSDSFVNRFITMAIFSTVELLGYILLTGQAYFPSLKPPKCSRENSLSNQCQKASGRQKALLLLVLYIIALGSGFMKSNLLAHGADQFDQRIPEQKKKMSNLFNWAYFVGCLGSLIALTLLVWVQDNIGRYWGFGISAMVMLVACVTFISGKSLYRNKVPRGSPLTRILKVLVAAFRNRHSKATEPQKGEYAAPQHKVILRFLDRAAMKDENSSSHPSPWRSCSVEQVEETKAFLRVLPIFGSTIVMNCAVAQLQTFSVQQGTLMITSFGNNFNVSPASLAAVPLLLLLFAVPLYDLFLVPFARKLTSHPAGFPTLQKTGLGLIISAGSMAVAALVETRRRSSATKLSILYLVPQFLLSSLAEFFTRVGLVEFLYSQSPPQMRSMSVALNSCSVSMGYFLSSLLVSVTNQVTMKSKKVGNSTVHVGGWLSNNDLNKDYLNRFYWMLCFMSIVNLFNFVFWALSYNYQSPSNTLVHKNSGSSLSEAMGSQSGRENNTHRPEIGEHMTSPQ